VPDATTYVQKKQTTILCKMKDQAIGLEIVEMAKAPNSPHPLIRAEGGVLLRFFCSTQPEATWVRMCLGPWEASELAAKIHTALDTKDQVEFTLAPHKFIRRTKDDKQGEEILTTWTIERWVREQNQAGAEHPAAGVPVRRRSPARPGRRGAGHRPPHAAPRGRRECGLAVRGHRDGSGRPRAPRPGDRPLVRKRSR
jgi:hypothetical protein